MKKGLMAVLLVIILAFTGCTSSSDGTTQRGSGSEDTADSEGRPYSTDFNEETNQSIVFEEIELQIPGNWEDVSTSTDSVIYQTGDVLGQLYITGTDSPIDLSDEDNMQGLIDSLLSQDSYSDVNYETTTIIDGVPALYATFTQMPAENTPYDSYHIAFCSETKMYIIILSVPQDSECNYSKDFDKIVDSITWVEETEEEPVNDFFSDEERQNEYEKLYTSYQFSELYDYVKSYVEDSGDSISESDSAYIIIDLIEPILETEGTWTVNVDDFDNSYSVTFNGADEISESESVCISLSGSSLKQTIGFRKDDWLFFNKYALSINGDVVKSGNVDSTSRNEDVISGGTIEESYTASNMFDDDICEQLKDAETAILRFENSSDDKNYDHTLTYDEKYALYASNLIRDNWVELSNLQYRYNNGIEYKSLKDY